MHAPAIMASYNGSISTALGGGVWPGVAYCIKLQSKMLQ